MEKHIKEFIDARETYGLHDVIMTRLRGVLKKSRETMQTNHYAQWDSHHEVYMHRRKPDKSDAESVSQGLPKKIVVPMTHSQVNTFVAFAYMLLTQRDRFYEFPGVEDMDQPLRECAEKLVQRDLDANCYRATLVQSLLDLAVRGMFVQKDWWQVEKVWLPVTETVPAENYNGVPTGSDTTVTSIKEMTRREGNVVRSVSPYKVFTDPAFHISDWKRGDFVATDEEYSKTALQQLQNIGVIGGLTMVPNYTEDIIRKNGRVNSRFSGIDLKDPDRTKDTVCITEVFIKWVPSEVKDEKGQALGSSTNLQTWLVWIANDSRIVRCEPYDAYHCQFPVSIGLFMPDVHETCLQSVARVADDLQSLISWFLNSRMAAVTRTVDGQFVVDPFGVETGDVATRQRLIRMKKAAAGKDARRFIMQLQHSDTTQGHVADIQHLTSMLQMVTGINDNAMGQYNGGRRSATEARNVTSGAASRMKIVLGSVWDMAFQPQSNRLLTNHRQAISPEEFRAVCGEEALNKYFASFKSTPEQLVRAYDFTTFDGTLSSEKMFLAQQLQEVLTLLISNPMSALSFGLSPKEMLTTITELRGVGKLGNFAMSPEEQQQLMMSLQPPPGQPTAPQ